MKQIPLGKSGLFAIVDDADYDWLMLFPWTLHREPAGQIYVVRNFTDKDGRRRRIRMHREILRLSKEQYGDHRNGNGLDNQRHNIRPATQQQNTFNRRVRKDNTAGARGVYEQNSGHWSARLQRDGVEIHIGTFDTKEQAVEARRAAEIKYFGEFEGTHR